MRSTRDDRSPTQTPAMTVCIVTRNRWEVAARAVASALAQRPAVDVIVIDDASADGTSARLAERFAGERVYVHRLEEHVGAPGARNVAMRLCAAPLVFFLDDDAWLADETCAARTARDFDDPRVAAVAVPFVEAGRAVQPPAPPGRLLVQRTFIGACHALRRVDVLAAGGYRDRLMIYAEESDLTIRLLARGLIVRAGSAAPAVHEPHAGRVVEERLVRRWRNEFGVKWLYTPAVLLGVALLAHGGHVLKRAWRRRRLSLATRTFAMALADWRRHGYERQPLSWTAYMLWRRLGREAIDIRQIEGVLARLAQEHEARAGHVGVQAEELARELRRAA